VSLIDSDGFVTEGMAGPDRSGRRWAPAVVLFFLSPAVGELLSSSAPPVEFFNPVAFVLLAVLYGGGALLCRELTIRWGKGWPTLLVLGAAYGIIEEGLMVKSFFNPNWMDIGVLGSYGRWGGVNWVWSLNLTVYHATISIAVPVLLTELLFRDRRGQSWVPARGLKILGGLFVLVVLVGFLAFGDGADDKTPYRPPAGPYLLCLGLVVALVWLARRMPRGFPGLPDVHSLRLKRSRLLSPGLFALGFLGVFAFYFIGWSFPEDGVSAVATIAVFIIFYAVLGTLVLALARRRGGWSERHQWALASGVLGFFTMLAFIWESGAMPRNDNPAGMAVVGVLAAVFLIYVRLRIRRDDRAAVSAATV